MKKTMLLSAFILLSACSHTDTGGKEARQGAPVQPQRVAAVYPSANAVPVTTSQASPSSECAQNFDHIMDHLEGLMASQGRYAAAQVPAY